MRFTINRQARIEVVEAARRYEAERPGLATEFFGEVRGTVESALAHPLMYPKMPRSPFRKATLSRFPYVIYYRLPSPDWVQVVAIVHDARHPRTWRHRA